MFAEIVPSRDFQEQRRQHPEKIFHLHVCTGFTRLAPSSRSAARNGTELEGPAGEALAEAFGIPIERQPGELRGHSGMA